MTSTAHNARSTCEAAGQTISFARRPLLVTQLKHFNFKSVTPIGLCVFFVQFHAGSLRQSALRVCRLAGLSRAGRIRPDVRHAGRDSRVAPACRGSFDFERHV